MLTREQIRETVNTRMSQIEDRATNAQLFFSAIAYIGIMDEVEFRVAYFETSLEAHSWEDDLECHYKKLGFKYYIRNNWSIREFVDGGILDV